MTDYIVRSGGCSFHNIFPGVDIATAAGQSLMLSLVTFEPHARVEPHSHPHEQMGLLIEGELHFTIGGEEHLVRPGDMWRIPGGVEHSCHAGAQRVKALDVFHPVRDDYR